MNTDILKSTGGELLMISHMQDIPASETKRCEIVARDVGYFNINQVYLCLWFGT